MKRFLALAFLFVISSAFAFDRVLRVSFGSSLAPADAVRRSVVALTSAGWTVSRVDTAFGLVSAEYLEHHTLRLERHSLELAVSDSVRITVTRWEERDGGWSSLRVDEEWIALTLGRLSNLSQIDAAPRR